jgi:hypothetical protein
MNSPLLKTSGTKVKLMRFYEWMSQMESPSGLHREWHTLLYLLIMVGIQRRWWPTINAMLSRDIGRVDQDAEDAPTGEPSAKPVSMSLSKEEANVKRKGVSIRSITLRASWPPLARRSWPP